MGEDNGILVGFDGSKEAVLALKWAIATALRDGNRLILVHSLPVEVTSSSTRSPTGCPSGPAAHRGWRPKDSSQPCMRSAKGACGSCG